MGRMAYLDAGAGSARPGYPRPDQSRTPEDPHGARGAPDLPAEAGAEGLEPPAYGFGDRRSTN
jgi:hypothetical protein